MVQCYRQMLRSNFLHVVTLSWTALVKPGPHLYTNANKVCGIEANPNKCPIHAKSDLFGVHLVKCTSNIVNVIFCESTNSKRIMFGCSPNICHTNKCCSLRSGYKSTTFLSFLHALFAFALHSCTDVDPALHDTVHNMLLYMYVPTFVPHSPYSPDLAPPTFLYFGIWRHPYKDATFTSEKR